VNHRQVLADVSLPLVPLPEHVDVVDVVGVDGNHLVGIVRVPAFVELRQNVSDRLLFVACVSGAISSNLRVRADDGKECNEARDEEEAAHRPA
jgi:hypothetical protein